MKNSLKKTARWSTLALAMGIMNIPAFQAQAAINWPGGTGDKNKDTEFQEGFDAGQEDCRNAPQPCGVKIHPMTKKVGYGETEPNDHILNADGLLLGQFYHANSLGTFDEDWYHVVTDKPNQKLTVYFLGDEGNFTETAGWVIQVRDLNGNIIAAFDTTTPGAGTEGGEEGGEAPLNVSPVDAAKITEVTLGKLGTYYISVKPKAGATASPKAGEGGSGGSGELRGYNIAINLENTGQVTANPDDNRFDTETEPNNDKANADPLRSNVAMTGVFNRTLLRRETVTTPAVTEIEYFYKDCKVDDISTIPSGLTSCECDLTSVDSNGDIVPPNPNTSSQAPGDACEARTITTPAETKIVGVFDYDPDVYVYHSEGNEQLRIQICTRTDCQFDKVHLRVNKDNTGIVLMEGPIEPGQTIDLGAALQGDYYFEFTAEEEGVISDTGDSQVSELLGPYDLLLMSTKFSPHGN
ncbi:hypothetical protein [Thiolapillus sp.]